MMGPRTACAMTTQAANEMWVLLRLRDEGAPVDDEIRSKASEIRRYLDAICDAMGAGE